MRVEFSRSAVESLTVDALIVAVAEESAPALGLACDAAITELYQSGEFKGKAQDLAVLHQPQGLGARRIALTGFGKREALNTEGLRKAVGVAVRGLKGKAARRIAFLLSGDLQTPSNAAAVVEGALLGEYEPDSLRTDPTKGEKRIEQFTLCAPAASREIEEAFSRGMILGESQNLSRDLANEPSNILTPTELANRARVMAAEVALQAEVLDEDRMRQLGMGSLLGVSMGSTEPPALIVLRYQPAGASVAGVHLGLVGKGVTFDSGGISIKPADNMDKMKYDMCGAAGVIGAMRAIALLKPSIPVTGFCPAVENMVSGRAMRPGDIVKSLDGKTIEVLNTDAEGRLILNDALTYAQRLGCTHLVDAATLTGAIVVALGHLQTGAFSNNQEFLDRVLAAARSQGERMWPMPLDEDYKEYLKSAFADLANIGGRWGGAITAAYFLKEFADPTPWVHLDIAGTAYHEEAKPWMAKGPTGVGLRTFVELAFSWR